MLHFPRWKLILVFVVTLAGILYSLPNLFPAATMAADVPRWLPHKQVNLGLDLQGGAHLLYQLDEKDMIEDQLNGIRGDVRETLRARPHRLFRSEPRRRQTLRVGDDPRSRARAAGPDRAQQARHSAGGQRVRGHVLQRHEGRARWGQSLYPDRDRRRPCQPHHLGCRSVDRDDPAPRRCARHHRAQHSARRPQSRSRPGARRFRRRTPENADRRDRQARIQAGRSCRRCATGGRHQAGAARR